MGCDHIFTDRTELVGGRDSSLVRVISQSKNSLRENQDGQIDVLRGPSSSAADSSPSPPQIVVTSTLVVCLVVTVLSEFPDTIVDDIQRSRPPVISSIGTS